MFLAKLEDYLMLQCSEHYWFKYYNSKRANHFNYLLVRETFVRLEVLWFFRPVRAIIICIEWYKNHFLLNIDAPF